MPGEANPSGTGASAPTEKLDSWKEIAAYLKRDIRTVQRWEKHEGLPAHRHQHTKKPTVYAYKSELDTWFRERQPRDDPAADAAFEPEPDADDRVVADDERDAPPAKTSVSPFTKQLISVVAAILVIAAGYKIYRFLTDKPAPAGKIRLAVLPFSNLSGDPAQDFFSAGLTDELITQLGSFSPDRLGVIAATSSKIVADRSIQEVGLALRVQYVVEGSVRREGHEARINVQLIEVKGETHLWAQSYSRDVSDSLRVQAEVASEVARQIGVALPDTGAGAKPRSINPEALDAYLKGSFYWTNRNDLPESIKSFQEAIQKDPNYALAYAGLASTYLLMGQVPNDGLPPLDAKPRARDAAQRALELDLHLGMAHAVLGNVAFGFDWNLPAAEREFRRAIELDANNPTAHEWYGHYLIVTGRMPEAVMEVSYALELDPVSPLFNTVRAETFYYARQYDQAIEQARRTLEANPNFWLAHFWLGSAYREKRMYPEALEQFRKARELSHDNPAMIMAYGHAQALAGNLAEARAALATLRNLAHTRYVPSLYFAGIHLGLREWDQAIAGLTQAYAEKTDRLIYMGVDPIADPLRSDARFRALLRQIGLPQ